MNIRLRWLITGLLLILPIGGTYIYQRYRPLEEWEHSSEGLTVYMKEQGVGRVVGFDVYAEGVLSAVLEPDAREETMKAMAVVLRTYVAYMSQNGLLVDSTSLGQPWLSEGERLAKGVDVHKIRKALSDTRGCTIHYNEKVILPLYFQVSNGTTRNFADVWGSDVAYLKSVESSWDKGASDYMKKIYVSRRKLIRCLSEVDGIEISWGQLTENMVQIVEKDPAGYIQEIQSGGQTYSGEDFRCRLGLPSACFDYEVKKEGILFTCYGCGHGVGLSIYGANAMAEEGRDWKEIILWYFPGTNV